MRIAAKNAMILYIPKMEKNMEAEEQEMPKRRGRPPKGAPRPPKPPKPPAPRGRPKLGAEKKSVGIYIRLTPEEHARFKRLARQAGITLVDLLLNQIRKGNK